VSDSRIVQRLHRTLLNERFRVDGRETCVETIHEMQVALDAPEWRKLLDAIPTETVRDLRDRERWRRELCWKCLGDVSGGLMVIGSGGKVNWCLFGRLLGEAVPSVVLAHGNLS
jgi:hypothetical protein